MATTPVYKGNLTGDVTGKVISGATPPAITFASIVPATETTGSCITTGSTWLNHSAVGACAVKLLTKDTSATGDYHCLRIRARSDAASADAGNAGCVGGNFSASAGIAQFKNLLAVQGFAQDYQGGTIYANTDAGHISTAIYGCMDTKGASSGRRWCFWADSHQTTKSSAGDYLMRFSHNGTVANDGLITVYGGGRVPLLMNIEDATPGFATAGSLTDSAAGDVACDARLVINWNGTPYYIPLFNTAA